MKHSTLIRPKNGGFQMIITYKYEDDISWRTKSKQGFKKQSEAKLWANQMIVELSKKEHNHSHNTDTTLGDAVQMFLETKTSLAPNTYLAYRNSLATLKPFEHTKLSKLNAHTTQKIATQTQPSYQKYLRIFWKYLLTMDMIDKSYLQFPKIKKEKKNRLISKEDYQKILQIKNQEIRAFCIVAYQLGMRTGEILGLTPECVKNDKIIVKQQWGKISIDDDKLYGFKVLKNGDNGYRELPSNPEIAAALRTLPFNFAQGRFFTIEKSDPINRALHAVGVSHTAHDFRHTRASEMVHAGFNLRYVAYFLGDTIETVISTYVNLSEEMVRDEEKKFVEKYF